MFLLTAALMEQNGAEQRVMLCCDFLSGAETTADRFFTLIKAFINACVLLFFKGHYFEY